MYEQEKKYRDLVYLRFEMETKGNETTTLSFS